MARKTAPQPPSDPELQVTRSEAARRIGERIAQGQELHARSVTNAEELEALESEYSSWSAYNAEMLRRLFTTPKFAEEYEWWGAVAISVHRKSGAERLADHRKEVREKIRRLESLRDRLELIPVAAEVTRGVAASAPREWTKKVFVVHGHDEGAREAVARFLERLGIEPVILHEQATGGRTIVEKLEYYANVDFAVVLLTPDDLCVAEDTAVGEAQPRARQNVVLELGFFVGKLGREHVCALYKGPLELPSDYLGVGYVPFDAGGGWRLQLAKELRSVGFAVDMNLAL